MLGLDYKDFVKHDPRYERPAEVDLLIGDPTKAKTKLGWYPHYNFKSLVYSMLQHDLDEVEVENPSLKGKSIS